MEFDTPTFAAFVAVVAFFVLLRVNTVWRILIAFILMTGTFDLLPTDIFGIAVWDIGALLLFVTAIPLYFAKASEPTISAYSIKWLWAFVTWLVVCLVYSLVIYRYPLINTLKSSRQMIFGYLSFFVFLRFFRIDKTALTSILKRLYFITFILLIVALVQSALKINLLFGLSVEFDGAIRYIPIFLPISLFFLWAILSKYLQGERLRFHEGIYATLVVCVAALTYTRGIYIAIVITLMIMFLMLLMGRRLKLTSILFLLLFSSFMLILILNAGLAERVIGRAVSGFGLVFNEQIDKREDADTYTGRLALAKERFALVAENNPVVGFGFLHEMDVPPSLRAKIKVGGPINTPEMLKKYAQGYPYVYGLYSPDIAWGNIVIYSGFVGLVLFLLFVITFLFSYKKIKLINPLFSHYRLAFFLQIITLLLTMFNGNTFTANVQIPALLLAGYFYASAKEKYASANVRDLDVREKGIPI